MSAWISYPTEPGLYIYHYKGSGYFGVASKRLPLAFDGKALWVCLPEGTRMYGQKAMLFRPKPGAGLFWRIPDPPPIGLIGASEDIRHAAGMLDDLPVVGPIDMGGGATAEIRKHVPGPPPPVMPLIKVETCPGFPAGTVVAQYGAAGKITGMATEKELQAPISGRWGWKGGPDAT